MRVEYSDPMVHDSENEEHVKMKRRNPPLHRQSAHYQAHFPIKPMMQYPVKAKRKPATCNAGESASTGFPKKAGIRMSARLL
jgi:hypothetical protein